MSHQITAELLQQFTRDHPTRVFNVNKTTTGLLPDYVRYHCDWLRPHHLLLAFADVVVIYDRSMIKKIGAVKMKQIAIDRWPVENNVTRFLFQIGRAYVPCYYGGLLAEGFRLLPDWSQHINSLAFRVRSEQVRYLRIGFDTIQDRLIDAAQRKWLLSAQKPSGRRQPSSAA